MQLFLPDDILRKMRSHMIRAVHREIGGMIMGEEIGKQKFRIVDFSVDKKSGTSSGFVRNADNHDQVLSDFFKKTNSDYSRFNYLGEWHTHPCFDIYPSEKDINSMLDLVDGTGGVDFAVLLISRLHWFWFFECGAYLFVRNQTPFVIDVIYEKYNA
ncbi:MAG: Mov34/MPN/PAD-1 family protein [Paracoccaceae bacterium]|nr:Mov34/MPN/PAD-1 family protein [Paracoccaceae bacterium]MDE2674601.1 Mov34/MPN/PAD-1 family protein [Paracoccaceae bacterium]